MGIGTSGLVVPPSYNTAIFAKPDVTVAGTAGAWTTANTGLVLFTVTGAVLLRVYAFTTANFTSTGATGTLAVGSTSSTGAYLPQTTVDGSNLAGSIGRVWVNNTPTNNSAGLPNSGGGWYITTRNVILTIATNNMTAGGMTLVCDWMTIPGVAGSLVAATP